MNIQFFLFLYLVCDRIEVLHRFLPILWDLIKVEYYFIAGQCQHSGMCCKGLSLVIDGNRVNSLDQFNQVLKRKSDYSRFVPIMDSSGEIDHFQCKCLDGSNRCTDYVRRPKICRDYPDSVFLQHDYIPEKCGYFVSRREFPIRLWIPDSVAHRIELMNSMNNITP